MLFLFVLALVAWVAPAFPATPDSWIAEPPPSIAFGKHDVISAGDIYEVVASLRGNAEAELQKIPLIPLSHAQARKFTGAYYSCPKGKRPYLVRALFGSGGTGKFWVYQIKREIWVLHEFLGQDITLARTALVLNLDFDPAKAYVTVSTVK
jgi:hypothetical protein